MYRPTDTDLLSNLCLEGLQAFGTKRSKARATLHGLLQESDSDDEPLQTQSATRGPFVWVPVFISAMCIFLATLCKVCYHNLFMESPESSSRFS